MAVLRNLTTIFLLGFYSAFLFPSARSLRYPLAARRLGRGIARFSSLSSRRVPDYSRRFYSSSTGIANTNEMENSDASTTADGDMNYLVEYIANTNTSARLVKRDSLPAGALIVKSLLWTCKKEPLLIVLNLNDTVDKTKLAAYLEVGANKHLKMASYDAVLEVTGQTVGNVSPVGHAKPVRTIIDEALLRQYGVDATVTAATGTVTTAATAENSRPQVLCYGGGGEDGYEIEIPLAELVTLSNAEVTVVSKASVIPAPPPPPPAQTQVTPQVTPQVIPQAPQVLPPPVPVTQVAAVQQTLTTHDIDSINNKSSNDNYHSGCNDSDPAVKKTSVYLANAASTSSASSASTTPPPAPPPSTTARSESRDLDMNLAVATKRVRDLAISRHPDNHTALRHYVEELLHVLQTNHSEDQRPEHPPLQHQEVMTAQKDENLHKEASASTITHGHQQLLLNEVINAGTISSGKTPLHLAAWKGSIENVKYLLDIGADVDQYSTGVGNFGKTAIFYAITQCRDDVVMLLLQYGARVKVVNNKGQTPRSLGPSHLQEATIQAIEAAEMKETELFYESLSQLQQISKIPDHNRELNGHDIDMSTGSWMNFYSSHYWQENTCFGDIDPRFQPTVENSSPTTATGGAGAPVGDVVGEAPAPSDGSAGLTTTAPYGRRRREDILSFPRSINATTFEFRRNHYKSYSGSRSGNAYENVLYTLLNTGANNSNSITRSNDNGQQQQQPAILHALSVLNAGSTATNNNTGGEADADVGSVSKDSMLGDVIHYSHNNNSTGSSGSNLQAVVGYIVAKRQMAGTLVFADIVPVDQFDPAQLEPVEVESTIPPVQVEDEDDHLAETVAETVAVASTPSYRMPKWKKNWKTLRKHWTLKGVPKLADTSLVGYDNKKEEVVPSGSSKANQEVEDNQSLQTDDNVVRAPVQLIIGKTLRNNFGDELARRICRSVREGQLVLVMGHLMLPTMAEESNFSYDFIVHKMSLLNATYMSAQDGDGNGLTAPSSISNDTGNEQPGQVKMDYDPYINNESNSSGVSELTTAGASSNPSFMSAAPVPAGKDEEEEEDELEERKDRVDAEEVLELQDLAASFVPRSHASAQPPSSTVLSGSVEVSVHIVDDIASVRAFCDLVPVLLNDAQTVAAASSSTPIDGNTPAATTGTTGASVALLPAMGVDCEWKPRRGPSGAADGAGGAGGEQPVAVLQIATRRGVFVIDAQALFTLTPAADNISSSSSGRDSTTSSSNWAEGDSERAAALAAFNTALADLFASPYILKLGYRVFSDFEKLAASFPHMECFQYINGVLDVSQLARQKLPVWRDQGTLPRSDTDPALLTKHQLRNLGLSKLCKVLFGKGLNKSQQCSPWHERPLTPEQVNYASLDAASLLSILDSFLSNDPTISPSASSETATAVDDRRSLEVQRLWDQLHKSKMHAQLISSYSFFFFPATTDFKPLSQRVKGNRGTWRGKNDFLGVGIASHIIQQQYQKQLHTLVQKQRREMQIQPRDRDLLTKTTPTAGDASLAAIAVGRNQHALLYEFVQKQLQAPSTAVVPPIPPSGTAVATTAGKTAATATGSEQAAVISSLSESNLPKQGDQQELTPQQARQARRNQQQQKGRKTYVLSDRVTRFLQLRNAARRAEANAVAEAEAEEQGLTELLQTTTTAVAAAAVPTTQLSMALSGTADTVAKDAIVNDASCYFLGEYVAGSKDICADYTQWLLDLRRGVKQVPADTAALGGKKAGGLALVENTLLLFVNTMEKYDAKKQPQIPTTSNSTSKQEEAEAEAEAEEDIGVVGAGSEACSSSSDQEASNGNGPKVKSRHAKSNSSPKSPPKYRTSSQRWRAKKVAAGSTSAATYRNEFFDQGRYFTWFIDANQLVKENSARAIAIRSLLLSELTSSKSTTTTTAAATTSNNNNYNNSSNEDNNNNNKQETNTIDVTDVADSVLLFIRQKTTPYMFCGRCKAISLEASVNADGSSSGTGGGAGGKSRDLGARFVQFTFELVDYDAITTTTPPAAAAAGATAAVASDSHKSTTGSSAAAVTTTTTATTSSSGGDGGASTSGSLYARLIDDHMYIPASMEEYIEGKRQSSLNTRTHRSRSSDGRYPSTRNTTSRKTTSSSNRRRSSKTRRSNGSDSSGSGSSDNGRSGSATATSSSSSSDRD